MTLKALRLLRQPEGSNGAARGVVYAAAVAAAAL